MVPALVTLLVETTPTLVKMAFLAYLQAKHLIPSFPLGVPANGDE
jgi:hypothetical protein